MSRLLLDSPTFWLTARGLGAFDPETFLKWARGREALRSAREARSLFKSGGIYRPDYPPIPDPKEVFKSHIDQAMKMASEGNILQASASLDRAEEVSRRFDDPTFASSIIGSVRQYLSIKGDKVINETVQSARSDLVSAFKYAESGQIGPAVSFADRAEKTIQTLPAETAGPLARMLKTFDRFLHETASQFRQMSVEEAARKLQESLSQRGFPGQTKKTAATAPLFLPGIIDRPLPDYLPPHITLPEAPDKYTEAGSRSGAFPFHRMLDRMSKNLDMAEKLLKTNEPAAAKLLRKTHDLLDITMQNAPVHTWDKEYPEQPEQPLLEHQREAFRKSLKKQFDKDIAKVRSIGERLFTLSMKSKTLSAEAAFGPPQ